MKAPGIGFRKCFGEFSIPYTRNPIPDALGLSFRLENRAAFVKAAACAGSMLQSRGATIRTRSERWLFELIMGAALIATRTRISMCWIWHGRFLTWITLIFDLDYADLSLILLMNCQFFALQFISKIRLKSA
jgi:hypothetical protein